MERLIEQITAAVQAIMKERQGQGAPAAGWNFGVIRFEHDPESDPAGVHHHQPIVNVILGEFADQGKGADHE